jgi:hypothetical protein
LGEAGLGGVGKGGVGPEGIGVGRAEMGGEGDEEGFFFFGEASAFAFFDDEDADEFAEVDDGSADEAFEAFFAGFGEVAVMGIGGGAFEVEGVLGFSDGADEAFADF